MSFIIYSDTKSKLKIALKTVTFQHQEWQMSKRPCRKWNFGGCRGIRSKNHMYWNLLKRIEESECCMVQIFVIRPNGRFSAVSESDERGTNSAPDLRPIRLFLAVFLDTSGWLMLEDELEGPAFFTPLSSASYITKEKRSPS